MPDTNVFSKIFKGDLAVTQFVANLEAAIDLIDTYSNSYGLLLADALIAANALENNLTVVTYNLNDFKFIGGLKTLKPPV